MTASVRAETPDDDLAAMADQLDAADRADFMDALGKASGCTQARNFACTEAQLKKAAKLAHGSADKRQLAAARQALSAEQAQVAEEARQQAELAEQERKLAEAEERLRVAEARAREAEADSQPSTASQLLQFGTLLAQNYAANKAGAAAAGQAGKLPLADLSADRQRIAEQRAKLAAAREQAEAARQASAQAAQARAVQAREQAAARQAAAAHTVSTSTPATIAATAPVAPVARSSTNPPTPTPTLLAQASAAPAARTSSTGSPPMNSAQNGASRQGDGAGTAAARDGSATAKVGDSSGSASKKKIEWGPVLPEALAVCRQGTKSGKWVCNGALDNQIIVDEPTVESALSRQNCSGGSWAAGGPVIDGVKWEAYRCGHSLGPGDYDVAKRYQMITARRQYICPQSHYGTCDTPYDGQDKR